MIKSQSLITKFFKSKEKSSKVVIKNDTNTFQKLRLFPYNHKIDYPKSRCFRSKVKEHKDAVRTYKGYCYSTTNNFREYEVHTIGDHLLEGHFLPEGTKIASATVDDDSTLESIFVAKKFRRQGIGKNLIHFIKKCDTQFHVYAGTEHNSRYRLTEEGAALIHACQCDGILEDSQVIMGFVPKSPS